MATTETIKRMVPPIVSLALFMEAIDTTIINTAIPSMAQSFRVSAIDLKITLISYLVSLAIFIPISGWLADRFGAKKIFMSAVVIFTLSSLACGFSQSLYELVVARLFQGLGGSLMIPVGRLIIVRLFHRTELIQTMNRVIIPALIGPALGPLLGGVITEQFSWRWIFWVNIPFGIVNFILAHYWLQDFKATKISAFDYTGFILLGVGLAGFAFGFSALSESAIHFSYAMSVIVLALLFLLGYFWHATRHTPVLLSLALFKFRTFRVSILGNLCSRLGISGVPFLLPLLLQIGLKYSPQVSGAMVAFLAVGAILGKFVSRRVIRFFGFKKILIINTLLLGLSLWLFMLINAQLFWGYIALITLLYGIMTSLQFSSMNPLVYADVPAELSSTVTSWVSVTQQMATSFGVATCALILGRFKTLSVSDFHSTFFILGIITIVASLVFLGLKKNDGGSLLNEQKIKPESI